MESFFALLPVNVLNRRRRTTARSYGWRSWSGSRRPTTVDTAKTDSAD
jgi:hypothetical protein